MHKIFRCSDLISDYFSKTIVEKKRIVDIYLLKIFLVSIIRDSPKISTIIINQDSC